MTVRDIVVTRRGARFMGRDFPCAIGRGGIVANKREGDGATPEGAHRIVGLLYRPDRVGRRELPGWARPIGPFDRWSDDPRDPEYNHYLPGPEACRPPVATRRDRGDTAGAGDGHRGTDARGYTSEALARPDPLYDILLVTDWNWPFAEKGRGSAIFVHVWRKPRHPTAGCVAFARRDVLWIARRLDYGARLIVRG